MAWTSPLTGYFENKQGMDLLTKTSTEGFNQMLSDYMKIYKGEMSPTDLPMYKNFVGSLETMFAKATPDIMREATARGIRGGSLANILQSGHTDLIDKSVKAIYDMYSQAPEGIAKTFGTTAGLGQQELQTLLGAFEAYKGRHMAGEATKYGQIMGGVTGGMAGAGSAAGGGACKCYIFMEGGGLTGNVRFYRDTYFKPNTFLSDGYLKMASWIVPVMKRNRLVKWIMKKIMIDPIVSFADAHRKDPKGLKVLFYCPFGLFWTKLWDMYGRIRIS